MDDSSKVGEPVGTTLDVSVGGPADLWEWDANDKESPAPNDLTEITKAAVELKEEIGKADAALKSKKERFQELSNQILKTLELMELDSVKAHGYLFFKEEKSSVVTPKTIEEKQALFDYLQEKGLFMEMVSVNSQTLNALYKSMAEQAAEEGILEFKLPGVPEPTVYTNLKLRRS